MNYFLKKATVTIGAMLLFVFLCVQLIFVPYKNNIFKSVLEPSVENSTIVVFGGGMIDKDTMTEMQEDRVRQAVKLYNIRKADKLFFTGDDGSNHYDEVHAMENLAVSLGVPKNNIQIDPHGYRTYESCYRLKYVYNINNIVAVSQSFHLSRIRYICEKMGIKTAGLDASIRDYGWRQVKADVREAFAKVKAVIQVEVTKPLPRSMEK